MNRACKTKPAGAKLYQHQQAVSGASGNLLEDSFNCVNIRLKRFSIIKVLFNFYGVEVCCVRSDCILSTACQIRSCSWVAALLTFSVDSSILPKLATVWRLTSSWEVSKRSNLLSRREIPAKTRSKSARKFVPCELVTCSLISETVSVSVRAFSKCS